MHCEASHRKHHVHVCILQAKHSQISPGPLLSCVYAIECYLSAQCIEESKWNNQGSQKCEVIQG